MRTILQNATIIDCTGRLPQKDSTLVIENERIDAIALRNEDSLASITTSGDRIFDLTGKYVLPGLWGVHTHLGAIFPDAKQLTWRESVADRTIRAGRNALDAIRVGITSVRVVGEQDYIDIAWKRAFQMNLFVGPRIYACGKPIIATGGHGHDIPGIIEVDGPYEMRKAVREQLKHGVDQIKIMVTGGVATAGEEMQESQMFLDEISAATDTAHQKGKRVCVHAGGPEGVKASVRGGVDCIEHGYYLDDEAIELMAQHNIFYVPTLFVTQYEDFMRSSGMYDYQIEKARGAMEAHQEGFQKALRAGIKIACGADSSPIGENTLVEIEQLVKAGMTEMQALIAATRTSAELCAANRDLGTVEPGKLADLIVLSADPLQDIKNVRMVDLVFKEGHLIDTTASEGQRDFWELYF